MCDPGIRHAQRFAVEDLASSAQTCQVRYLVKQGSDNYEGTSGSPLDQSLFRRSDRWFRRHKLSLTSRSISTLLVYCCLLYTVNSFFSRHLTHQMRLDLCQPMLRSGRVQCRIISFPQRLYLSTNLCLDYLHERNCRFEVAILVHVQQAGLILRLLIKAVCSMMRCRMHSRAVCEAKYGWFNERLESHEDGVHTIPHLFVLFLHREEAVHLPQESSIGPEESVQLQARRCCRHRLQDMEESPCCNSTDIRRVVTQIWRNNADQTLGMVWWSLSLMCSTCPSAKQIGCHHKE
mmetsp:Transcript_54532/g.122487  ORF Transcript_54532/g.122487 Transcript_54532/m.122487 type:complete len:291 (+) Transcript_54532:509-1381(+)